MGLEIERKFLVDRNKWNQVKIPEGAAYRQGYFLTDPQKTIRVRSTPRMGYLTIKGLSTGAVRPEFEYEIPREEAEELLNHFPLTILSKIRYKVPYKGKIWNVDKYLGKNAGLMTAEIELTDESEAFSFPDWIGEEVTGKKEYYNSNLTLHPYNEWKE